jgi:hypothetical protein
MIPVTQKPETRGRYLLLAVIVAFLAAILLATAWVLKSRVGFKSALGADTTSIEIIAAPWGTVKSVAATDGSVSRFVNQQTPLRVQVPPGQYAIVMFAPDGHEYQQTVIAGNGGPGRWHIVLGGFDPAIAAPGTNPELMHGIRAYYDGDYLAAEKALAAQSARSGPPSGMAAFFLGASRLSRLYLQGGNGVPDAPDVGALGWKDETLLNAARDAFRQAAKTEGFVVPEPYVSPKIVETYKSVSR